MTNIKLIKLHKYNSIVTQAILFPKLSFSIIRIKIYKKKIRLRKHKINIK